MQLLKQLTSCAHSATFVGDQTTAKDNMTAPAKELVRFALLDINAFSSGEPSYTKLYVGALHSGAIADLAPPVPDDIATQAFNHNLGNFALGWSAVRTLAQTWNLPQNLTINYCSRCGGRFAPDHCIGCNVAFTPWQTTMEFVPAMPNRLREYVKATGYVFTH